MKTIVIHDRDGIIYNVIYGATDADIPKDVPYVWLDIPNGCTLKDLDMSTEPPTPVYDYWPAIDLESVKNRVKTVEKTVGTHTEDIAGHDQSITTIELALVEMYEAGNSQAEPMSIALSARAAAGTSAIVSIYANLISKGVKTIDEVPPGLADEVKVILGPDQESANPEL